MPGFEGNINKYDESCEPPLIHYEFLAYFDTHAAMDAYITDIKCRFKAAKKAKKQSLEPEKKPGNVDGSSSRNTQQQAVHVLPRREQHVVEQQEQVKDEEKEQEQEGAAVPVDEIEPGALLIGQQFENENAHGDEQFPLAFDTITLAPPMSISDHDHDLMPELPTTDFFRLDDSYMCDEEIPIYEV